MTSASIQSHSTYTSRVICCWDCFAKSWSHNYFWILPCDKFTYIHQSCITSTEAMEWFLSVSETTLKVMHKSLASQYWCRSQYQSQFSTHVNQWDTINQQSLQWYRYFGYLVASQPAIFFMSKAVWFMGKGKLLMDWWDGWVHKQIYASSPMLILTWINFHYEISYKYRQALMRIRADERIQIKCFP